MLREFRQHVLSNSLTTALRKRAEVIGEEARHQHLADYWTEQAKRRNPGLDHWGYAEAREKQLEHIAAMARAKHEVRSWNERITRLEQKLNALGHAPAKPPCLFWFWRRGTVRA